MPGCGIRANDKTIVSHHLPVKFLVRLEAVRINGEIFKRWNGGFFGSSNAVFNAAPQSEPSKGTKARSFAILRLFKPQYPVQWRPCFSGFRDSANFIPPGYPAAGFEPMIKLLSLTSCR